MSLCSQCEHADMMIIKKKVTALMNMMTQGKKYGIIFILYLCQCTHYWRLAIITWHSNEKNIVASRSIIYWSQRLRQITDLWDTDKFCGNRVQSIIIILSFNHQICFSIYITLWQLMEAICHLYTKAWL